MTTRNSEAQRHIWISASTCGLNVRSLKQATQQKMPLLQLFCMQLTRLFDRVCFLSLLWTAPGLSVTCIVAVTQVTSMETEHISHGNKSRAVCYFYWPYPPCVDTSSNESVIVYLLIPLTPIPQHFITFNAPVLHTLWGCFDGFIPEVRTRGKACT